MGGKISVVFYDMTTFYFEASDEDDLRKTGLSKYGKHQNPQIFIACWLVWADMPLVMIFTKAILMKVIHLSPFLKR